MRRGWRLAIAGVAVVLMAVWLVRLGPREVAAAAIGAHPGWLAASFIPLLLRFVTWGRKFRAILSRLEPVPFWPTLEIQLAGSFVNLTTPTAKLAGGAMRALVLEKRYGWSLVTAYGRTFADQATTVLGTLGLLGFVAVVASLTVGDFPGREATLWGGSAILTAMLSLVVLRNRLYAMLGKWSWLRRLEAWIERRLPERLGTERGLAAEVLYPFLGEGRSITTLIPDLARGAQAFAMVCVSNVFIFKALGVTSAPGLIALAVVLGYFAGLASGWGGIGVTEATMTALFVQFGIEPDAAAAGALLHRASFYLLVLVWGGWSFTRVAGELGTAR